MAGKENNPQDQAGQEMRSSRGRRKGTSPTENKRRGQSERSADRVEKRARGIVSVTELIPGINVEGLILKGSPDQERNLNFDYNPEFRYRGISSKLATPFAKHLYHFYYLSPEGKKSAEETINEALQDHTVLDLGAGPLAQGYYVVDRARAKGYVAVEPYFTHETAKTIADIQKYGNNEQFRNSGISLGGVNHQIKFIPSAVVAEGMLEFLKRVPANSVSVFCAGINREVIDDDYYIKRVGDEIVRVLAKNGAYIGDGDMHIPLPWSKDIDYEYIGDSSDYDKHGNFYLYKKVETTEK